MSRKLSEYSPTRRTQTLTIGIVAITGLVLLVMWLVVAASINQSRDMAMQQARLNGRNLAAAFGEEVTHGLDGIADEMEIVAERMRAEGSDLDLYRWASELSVLSARTIQGSIIGPDGKLVSTSYDSNAGPVDLSDREHFRIHLDGNFKGLFIGPPIMARVSKQVQIPISMRIDSRDGRFLGVLVYLIPPGSLTELPQRVELGGRGALGLIGLDDVIRARFTKAHPDGLDGVGQSIAGSPRPSQIPENGEGFYVRKAVLDGITRIFVYRRLRKYPLVANVALDLDEALAGSRAHAITVISLTALASLLLCGLAGFLFRESRSRSRRELEQAEEQERLRAANLTVEKANQELLRSREDLARAQRIAGVGSFSRDLVTGHTEWSDECRRIWGISDEPSQVAFKSMTNLIHPEDRQRFIERRAAVLQGALAASQEFRIIRPDGEERVVHHEFSVDFDENGKPVRSFGTIQDITERKKIEVELRRSGENLARAQRIASIGSFERDLVTGRNEWSEEMYRILGLEKGQVVPSFETVLEMVQPADRELFRAAGDASVEGVAIGPLEFRIVRPDGSERFVRRENGLIFDEHGKPICVYGSYQDITERLAIERRERELERRLLHSQKLEALGTLAGGIAHDLNNSLTPIMALSKMSVRRLEPGNALRTNLETIYAASEQARDLVKRVLAFSRNDEIDKKSADLREIVSEALQLLRATIATSIRLDVELSEVPTILADASQIHQVITNLVTNAAQAIGSHAGVITVTLDAALGSSPEPTICLSVGDTGEGMDEATRERIFEPFFTTKDVGQGTGLGLSIIAGIVADHGGHIEVQSEPGKGSLFKIYFPVPDAHALAAA